MSILNSFTITLVTSLTYDSLSTTVGAVSVGLLIVLLVLRETSAGGERRHTLKRNLDIAIFPLLLSFGVIIFSRLFVLMR